MSFLDRLERWFGRLAIPNLTLFLVLGQLIVYLGLVTGRLEEGWFLFIPQMVVAGEWWRLITFVLMPPHLSILFIAFAWYMFYLMGRALEEYWGDFHYNLFLFIGYALTVGLSFLDPGWPVSNLFLAGSVFLAFAYLNPNFEIAIFFILPVRIKWLAILTWAGYLLQFVRGNAADRLEVAAAVGNFFVFFGRDIWLTARHQRRRMANDAARLATAAAPGRARHRCRICGRTDVTNPELDFRYCSKCAGEQCYCPDHIQNHEHVVEAPHEK